MRNLGAPDEMRKAARQTRVPLPALAANAHIHLPPNFSAFQSVGQAVRLAAEQSVRVLGASNYYDFTVYSAFASRAWELGIYPLFGLEIIALLEDLRREGILVNDPGNHGRMYLCGKGIVRFAPPPPKARELLDWIRKRDAERMRQMVSVLARIFAERGLENDLDHDKIISQVAHRAGLGRSAICLQERHVAQAFQEEFFRLVDPSERSSLLGAILGVPSKAGPDDKLKVQQEIRSALMKVGKPAFVKEKFVDFRQALRLVLELGGIPCYPVLADGTNPVCAYEDPPEKLAGALKSAGVFCAEFIPIRNRSAVLERYVRTLRNAGMVITAGTEHNTPELVPMEPRCLDNLPAPEEVHGIFWEGACVVAAHQFQVQHGECGYVDSAGALNPEFGDSESRIAFFAGLGAALIARYREISIPTR